MQRPHPRSSLRISYLLNGSFSGPATSLFRPGLVQNPGKWSTRFSVEDEIFGQKTKSISPYIFGHVTRCPPGTGVEDRPPPRSCALCHVGPVKIREIDRPTKTTKSKKCTAPYITLLSLCRSPRPETSARIFVILGCPTPPRTPVGGGYF